MNVLFKRDILKGGGKKKKNKKTNGQNQSQIIDRGNNKKNKKTYIIRNQKIISIKFHVTYSR